MTSEEQLMWGSHLPALAACVSLSTGPVLELGVGEFSTPLLHGLCGALGRQLVSVESDRAWVERLGRLSRDWHKFYHGSYDEWVPRVTKDREWGVVLIDNSPGGERRAKDFQTVLENTAYILVHDYHKDNEQAIAPLLQGRCYTVCRRQEPPTLVFCAGAPILPDVLLHL